MIRLRWLSSRFPAVAIAIVYGCALRPASCQVPEPPSVEAASATFTTPPAPALSPLDEMKTITLADGYHLQLVAADPLVQDPIAITFDPGGRIWVCEMRGFMPDIDGTNEEAPIGVISVLDDSDGDGLMDCSTVFLDGLVLPRGLCWTVDGLLVCENGTIWLCVDADGDDRCDEKQEVCTYNRGNIEHSLNGLMPALDNRIYNAKEGLRLQRVNGQWVPERYAARGQWGITQDNHGYLRYNVNASLIRGDLVPCYSTIAETNNALVDVQLYDDQTMYPIRPTPGINRGYIPGFLRPDGSLIEANSNCGPVVYRGDNLPSDLLGDVFIPEPAGNLVRRQVVSSVAGRTTSHNAYDQEEFLASTDERFRPVNMFNSPDGTLYIVDMYRGIIQHGAFITPYLREQILSRQLDKEVNLGRIFRVVHDSTLARSPPSLTDLSNEELVGLLSHSNGWHRDMAQQLLVQRGDTSVVEAVENVAASDENPLGRLHAVWTLAGLNRLDPELLFELLTDPNPYVRASSVHLYRRFLLNPTMFDTIVDDIAEVAADDDLLVRLEVSQALGLVESTEADQAIEPILKDASSDDKLLDGILSGFSAHQSEFLAARLNQDAWAQQEPWRETVLRASAGVMWRDRSAIAVLRFCRLLDSVPEDRSWQLISLMEGVKEPPPPQPRRRFAPQPGTVPRQRDNDPGAREQSVSPGVTRSGVGSRTSSQGQASPFGFGPRRSMTLQLDTVPAALDRLRVSSNTRVAAAANAFAEKLIWPGKDGKPLPVKRKLTQEQQHLYDVGQNEYVALCAGCHHTAGYGLAAKGPQLLGSPWLEDEQRLTRLVLHGVQGPLDVNGELYNSDGRMSMPGMHATLNDEKIAGVLTYVRREFYGDAPPVDRETVTSIRRMYDGRSDPWTQQELLDVEP